MAQDMSSFQAFQIPIPGTRFVICNTLPATGHYKFYYQPAQVGSGITTCLSFAMSNAGGSNFSLDNVTMRAVPLVTAYNANVLSHTDYYAFGLDKEVFLNLKSGYLLAYTEANERNLNDSYRYIKKKNYFKLLWIKNRIPYFEDDLGETIECDLYKIYLLIDQNQKCYFAIVYVPLSLNRKVELKKYIKTSSISRFLCFNNLQIYPVKVK